MNVQCTSKLQRFNRTLLFILTIAITAPTALAEKFDATIDILPLRSDGQFASSPNKPLQNTDWLALGTHDSGPLPTPAPPVLIARAKLARQHATTARKVVVKQVVEPFIALGPFTPNALKASEALEPWQITFEPSQPARSPAHLTPLDLQLQELAQEEPLDIESLGPSVLIPENHPMQVRRIEVAPINPLIGSSPIIATIEEDYMPYDLSARDLKDWNSYPIETHPFTADDHVSAEQTASLWDDFDVAMALSRSSDPVELNGLAKANLGIAATEDSSPSSPSDLVVGPEARSETAKQPAYQESDQTVTGSTPVATKEDTAITSEEALAILARPEKLSLSPAPKDSSNPVMPETVSNRADANQAGTVKAGPADVALKIIIDSLSNVDAFNASIEMVDVANAAGKLFGSYSGNAGHWLGKRVADITLNWPAQGKQLQSRAGAKLLSRASVLESGMIEENTIGSYIPVERLDGVDCGSQATIVVADRDNKTRAR